MSVLEKYHEVEEQSLQEDNKYHSLEKITLYTLAPVAIVAGLAATIAITTTEIVLGGTIKGTFKAYQGLKRKFYDANEIPYYTSDELPFFSPRYVRL